MSVRTTSLYKNHRFPPEIIAHTVWLYHRFSLSFREVEELLAERSVTVSYEAVRLWCLKFGQTVGTRAECKGPIDIFMGRCGLLEYSSPHHSSSHA